MKKELKKQLQELIKEGEVVKNDEKDLKTVNEGYWKTRSKKNAVQKKGDTFVSKAVQFEQSYDLFIKQLKYASLNPLVFYGKLALGVFLSCLSLVIWTHM